jgi:hypothetical protein
MTIILVVMGVLLAIRLPSLSYHVFLAGFLIFFAHSFAIFQGWWWLPGSAIWMQLANTSVTGALFIYSMMRFSGKHNRDAYRQYFVGRRRPKFYKNIVVFFSQDKPFWLLLFPLLLAGTLGDYYFTHVIGALLNILILVLGLIYFRISYAFSGKENQNRLTWMLWGLIMVIGFYFVELFLFIFYDDLGDVFMAVYLIKLLIICLSFALSIFFFKSTDARFFVRKTLIYGAILLAGLFVFGTIEHFIIHTIAHSLHIQSSLLNSCLGAALALLIRPLHHKVEHWLTQWESKKVKVSSGRPAVEPGS